MAVRENGYDEYSYVYWLLVWWSMGRREMKVARHRNSCTWKIIEMR